MHTLTSRLRIAVLAGVSLMALPALAADAACTDLNDCMMKGGGAGSPAAAIPYYSKGLQLWKEGSNSPAQRALATYIRAQTYIQNYAAARDATNLDLAEKDLQAYIGYLPEKYDGYMAMGIVMANRGQLDKAVEWMNKGVAAEPKNPLSLYERGNFYLTKRDYALAVTDFTSAINLLPRKGYDEKTGIHSLTVGVNLPPERKLMIYHARAQAYQALGKEAEAAADFDTMCAMGEKRAC